MAAGTARVMVIGIAAAYVAVLMLKVVLAMRAARLARAATTGLAADRADVAILQAILSGDPGLEAALESNLQALAGAHFIWLVDEDDPAGGDLCASLRRRHADARIDILATPPAGDGINPKLCKLAQGRTCVTERVIVVLDDDTRMPAATLSALVEALGHSMLSTALPGYLDTPTWPSRLLASFVNNNAAATYLTMLATGPAVAINGMAYALETDTLDGLGGFGAMEAAVTDDLAMAGRVMAAGGRICQSPAPVFVRTTVGSGALYIRLMHRWYVFALILVANQPVARRALIAGLYATPPALLWTAIAMAIVAPSAGSAVVIGVAWLIRSLALVAVQRHIYGLVLHHPIFSIVSELLQPLHFAHALMQRTIAWRTRRYRVNLDQTFRRV